MTGPIRRGHLVLVRPDDPPPAPARRRREVSPLLTVTLAAVVLLTGALTSLVVACSTNGPLGLVVLAASGITALTVITVLAPRPVPGGIR